jgi:HK97 family phage prohead protease
MDKMYATTEVKANKDEERIVEFIASSEVKTDYDGDIVKIDGMDINQIKKNKSFLWSHNQSQPPIGKILSMKKDGKVLLGKAQMTSEEEYPFGYQIYKLIKGGYINNVSISFIPDFSKIEYKEQNGKQMRIINASTLLEVSAVNIGANNQAVITNTKSLKDTFEKAWEDGVLDGKDLNLVNEVVDNYTPDIESEDKDAKIVELENKIKQLECEIEVLSKDEEELNDIYKEIFDTFQGGGTEQVADTDHTDLLEEFLNLKN